MKRIKYVLWVFIRISHSGFMVLHFAHIKVNLA